jgi:hypothetical protein
VTGLAAALINGAPLSPEAIEQAARQVPGFNSSNSAVATADGYIWLRVLEFRTADSARSAVAIAIPHARDYSRADGSQLDRMPAVYLRRGASVDDANAVLVLLVAGM